MLMGFYLQNKELFCNGIFTEKNTEHLPLEHCNFGFVETKKSLKSYCSHKILLNPSAQVKQKCLEKIAKASK